MKANLRRATAIIGCLAVAIGVAIIVLKPEPDSHELALASLKLQGNEIAQVRLLSGRLNEDYSAWPEAVEYYEDMIAAITRLGDMDTTTRNEVSAIWVDSATHVALIAVDKENWEVASDTFSDVDDAIAASRRPISSFAEWLDSNYLQARLQVIVATTGNLIAHPEELEAQISRLAQQAIGQDLDYLPLFKLQLSQLAFNPSVDNDLALIACQQAGWSAFTLGDETECARLVEHETELSPAPGSLNVVSLSTVVLDDLGDKGTLWQAARNYQLAVHAGNSDDLESAAVVLQELDSVVARSGKPLDFFADYLDAQYFDLSTRTLVSLARTGSVSTEDLQASLKRLQIVALERAHGSTEPLSYLQTIYESLGEGNVSEDSEVEEIILREQAVLSLATNKLPEGLQYWETAARLGEKTTNSYTLQELILHPEIAIFSIEGNDTYTSIDIRFTYVSRPIDVVLIPCVFRYIGHDGYQDMGVYRVERWTIAAPDVKTVPAVCLDFDAKTPKQGVSDYELRELLDYAAVDRDLLSQRLNVLELTEISFHRFAELGLAGEWDAVQCLHSPTWERVRALSIWSLTNPDKWNRMAILDDLISHYIEPYVTQPMVTYVADDMPTLRGIPRDEHEFLSTFVVGLLLGTREEQDSRLDEFSQNPEMQTVVRHIRTYISENEESLLLIYAQYSKEAYEQYFKAAVADALAALEWLEEFGINL